MSTSLTKRELAKAILIELGWLNVKDFVDTCTDAEVDDAVLTAVKGVSKYSLKLGIRDE